MTNQTVLYAQAMAKIYREAKKQGASPTMAAQLATGKTPVQTNSLIMPNGTQRITSLTKVSSSQSATPTVTSLKDRNSETETVGRIFDKEVAKRKYNGTDQRRSKWV